MKNAFYLILKVLFVLKIINSHPEVFCKKVVLKNFTKLTGKHLCHNLFFNKDAGLRPATLLKKRLWHRCFPVNFSKFLRTPFVIEHLWWLLLSRCLNICLDFLSCRKNGVIRKIGLLSDLSLDNVVNKQYNTGIAQYLAK